MNKEFAIILFLSVVVSLALAYVIVRGGYFTPVHDIAVTKVIPSRPDVYVGDMVNIEVVVRNKGNQAESFDLTLYRNNTLMGIQAVANLISAVSANLTFTWNTTEVASANYVIKAEASIVPSETSTSDNTLIYDALRVREQPMDEASIHVHPKISMAAVNRFVTAKIDISGVVDLYRWQLKLRWNGSILDFVSIEEGSFLKQRGKTLFTFSHNTAGMIIADDTLASNSPGANDNGTLLTIVFRVKEKGNCALDAYDTRLVTSLDRLMVHTVYDGRFASFP